MPRRKDDLIVKKKISLPATLCGRVEFILHDPSKNRPAYGALSDLITTLLTEWVARVDHSPLYPSPEK